MTGKEFYKSTFDEIQVSEHMIAKLMMMSGEEFVSKRKYGIVYRIAKVVITFASVFAASGALYSVPLLG